MGAAAEPMKETDNVAARVLIGSLTLPAAATPLAPWRPHFAAAPAIDS